MSKAPKFFTFVLTPEEIGEILRPAGQGGHQTFHKLILAQLAKTGNTITLNDEALGKLLRYMTQYKGGGFQGQLRAAFGRVLKGQFGL